MTRLFTNVSESSKDFGKNLEVFVKLVSAMRSLHLETQSKDLLL